MRISPVTWPRIAETGPGPLRPPHTRMGKVVSHCRGRSTNEKRYLDLRACTLLDNRESNELHFTGLENNFGMVSRKALEMEWCP